MKILLFALCIISSIAVNAQQGSLPKYKLTFQYRNSSGVLKDTVLARAKYKIWSESATYPDYVKWKGQHFAILHSAISGVGLFTDSITSFSADDQIAFAFFKTGSSGHFDLDYTETNVGSFVNDSSTPNMEVIVTSQGVMLKAKQAIGPNTELTADYQSLINLFPNDESVNRAVKYW